MNRNNENKDNANYIFFYSVIFGIIAAMLSIILSLLFITTFYFIEIDFIIDNFKINQLIFNIKYKMIEQNFTTKIILSSLIIAFINTIGWVFFDNSEEHHK